MVERCEKSWIMVQSQHVSSALSETPDICAAVCTRDRPRELARLLRSLLAQTRPPAEILVVDNAPSDERVRRLVERDFPSVGYSRESIAGLDFARNHALRSTEADFVAFIDDDAVAESVWIERLSLALMAQPSPAVCTGRILPLALDTEGQKLFEANGGLADGGTTPIELPQSRGEPWLRGLLPAVWWAATIGSGCNLTVHRRFALELGGFDEALDLGGDLAGGGDTDLIWRALETGSRVVYDPTVRVYHEHRGDAQEAIAQITRHHRTFMAFLAKAVEQTPGSRKMAVLAYLMWRLVKPGFRLARRTVGLDPLPARAIVRMWGQSVLGMSDYPGRCREAQLRKQGRE